MDESTRGARRLPLFEATYPALLRYARHRGMTGHDGEDLTAAVYEIAWRRLDRVPPGDQALPWLLAVARNLARNERRRLARERAILELLPAPNDSASRSEPAPISWQEIRQALATLDEKDRELVLLVAWDGIAPSQAGSVLGCSQVAARSRLDRARRRLSEALGMDRHDQRRPARSQGRGRDEPLEAQNA